MSRVFISYRRDDSADVTGRIFDRLRAHFDRKVLFRDVDTIPLGRDFREVIAEAVDSCEILLAVIGPLWVDIRNDDGVRRLDDPHDFVRLEIETALRRKIAVIPVMVGRARMPQAGQLPEALQPLAFRNGLEVRRDPDFHNDMDRLIGGLTAMLNTVPSPLVGLPVLDVPRSEVLRPEQLVHETARPTVQVVHEKKAESQPPEQAESQIEPAAVVSLPVQATPGQVIALRATRPQTEHQPGESLTLRVTFPPERKPGEITVVAVSVPEPPHSPGELTTLSWKAVKNV
jgi:hypothetical protein